ncbi:NAD(P)-binding protein [Hypoxylon rubiginosum]|uniref:NAD(P)-binding protein n=1 Tax=Hypoxylon rubiginosum TaxID=110542 RepID=A0ACC0DAI5_9PEZI|nr:NAD(P)-binding protein [Hypoxylon rubiginosum]
MPLLHLSLQRVLGRFVAKPLPPVGSFDNQTVLITGGTAGLGLAAAVHFASLGANIILTYRDASRGESARRHVEEAAHISGQQKVTVMHLDMSRYASCTAFVNELKKSHAGRGGLDVIILNAGRINPRFEMSPEGWEETIQVNALSTILLGLLLSEWMKLERGNRETPAHLVFVSSRDHLYPDVSHWAEWSKQGGILHHLSSQQNWPPWWATTEPNYDNSKLLLMYAIDEILKRVLGPDNE